MRPHWKVRFSQETTIVSGIAVISAIALGLLIPASIRLNQDTTALHKNPTEENKRLFDASLEHVKAIVGGIGTIATIVGGVVLYLNFRVAKQNTEITENKQITERFSKAVEQLGSDKIEVRLGGIYSLERIAKDSPADHWTIMEVLTAFVRERTIPTSTAQPTVSTDVQAALTVIGRREVTRETKDQRLDLNGTNLSRASLQGANLQQASIQGANLERADLQEANLQATHLLNANLPMAIFQNTNLQGAYLVNANLQGAYLVKANLQEAYLVNANLQGAYLQDANLQGADFRDAQLNDSIMLTTDLRKTQNLTLAQLTGDNPPLLCNVALPTTITGINPHRDCDQMPQKLVEQLGEMSLENATQVVNKAKQKQWQEEKIPPPHP